MRLSFLTALGFLLLGFLQVCAAPDACGDDRIKVFVSILPQAYFAERLAGERAQVSVMVGPGQSPATYEPRPRQMAELGSASLYFRIGVPFENVWVERISKENREMMVVDTRRGITLLPMKGRHEHGNEGHDHHTQGMKDPHVWLSLRLVTIQIKNMYEAFVRVDPGHKEVYGENVKAFLHDLEALDHDITETLRDLKTRRFMILHPALGYFAQDYGLEQIPIEVQGKQPSAKDLDRIIREAREGGIKAIFVQKQFSQQSAESVARAIQGRVVQVDPLARDYLNNMRSIAQSLAEALK